MHIPSNWLVGTEDRPAVEMIMERFVASDRELLIACVTIMGNLIVDHAKGEALAHGGVRSITSDLKGIIEKRFEANEKSPRSVN